MYIKTDWKQMLLWSKWHFLWQQYHGTHSNKKLFLGCQIGLFDTWHAAVVIETDQRLKSCQKIFQFGK